MHALQDCSFPFQTYFSLSAAAGYERWVCRRRWRGRLCRRVTAGAGGTASSAGRQSQHSTGAALETTARRKALDPWEEWTTGALRERQTGVGPQLTGNAPKDGKGPGRKSCLFHSYTSIHGRHDIYSNCIQCWKAL